MEPRAVSIVLLKKMCIVEEHADYLLDVLLVLFGERWGCTNDLHILSVCTVQGFDVGIWLVLRLCQWRVLESDECLRYIIEHGSMDVFVDVVLVDIHSKIACAVPVMGAFIVFIQDAGEVINVFTANVFDAKVVNAE
jgi:hypothetical protein